MSKDPSGVMTTEVSSLQERLDLLVEQDRPSYSQWQLMWRDFRKHRLAVGGMVVVILFYVVALLGEFLAPHDPFERTGVPNAPPSRVRIHVPGEGLQRPFVYGYTGRRNPRTLAMEYRADEDKKYLIRFFASRSEYRFMGLIPTSTRLFTVEEEGHIFLFGSDALGRDVFSRTIVGTRISSTVGLIGIFFSLFLGLILGGASALFGGYVDVAIQRVIEVLLCIPGIPLWMGLSAALPREWSPLQIYFAITVILALHGWIGVARVVRGKFLSTREEQFVIAAEGFGAGPGYLIGRHLIPNFLSYIIVNITIGIPGMILGETALSFLGLGLRPPIVSWGVLLQRAQNLHAIAEAPWLMFPGLFVVVLVLAFNFMGDGLRDAADPYKRA